MDLDELEWLYEAPAREPEWRKPCDGEAGQSDCSRPAAVMIFWRCEGCGQVKSFACVDHLVRHANPMWRWDHYPDGVAADCGKPMCYVGHVPLTDL